jgi:hypothetical protein
VDSIRRGAAYGNAGATDITAAWTGVGLHFIEVTGFGSLNVTTVFRHPASDGFSAVTSRHVYLLLNPLPSQYHGVCKIWE